MPAQRLPIAVLLLMAVACGGAPPAPEQTPPTAEPPVGGIFAEGEDPIAGRWSLAIETTEYGPKLVLQGAEDPASILIHPVAPGVLGDWLLSSHRRDALLLVVLVDARVKEAFLEFDDGSTIQGTLHPMPSAAIGSASVLVAGFRGEMCCEGTELTPDGSVVVLDEGGVEFARRPILGD